VYPKSPLPAGERARERGANPKSPLPERERARKGGAKADPLSPNGRGLERGARTTDPSPDVMGSLRWFRVIGPRYREDLCHEAAAVLEKVFGILTPIDPR